MSVKSDCYGCTKRHFNCHSTCDNYLEYKEELEKSKPDTDHDFMSYHVDRINKSKKRR